MKCMQHRKRFLPDIFSNNVVYYYFRICYMKQETRDVNTKQELYVNKFKSQTI